MTELLVITIPHKLGKEEPLRRSSRRSATPWLLHKFAEAMETTISGRGRVLLQKK
jgi:hypothetical protein